MTFFEKLGNILSRSCYLLCRPLHTAFFSEHNEKRALKLFLSFTGGILLGQLYYIYLLKKIPFPYYIGLILSLIISVFLGVCNIISKQMRCISLLIFPMYCGKPGRGVLKAVVLTYVVAGPITNLGFNAKEVVRVYACSTQLSHNLTKMKHALISAPMKKALLGLNPEMEGVKDTLRSIADVLAPIESEMLSQSTSHIKEVIRGDYSTNDLLQLLVQRINETEKIFKTNRTDEKSVIYEKTYLKKAEQRCNVQMFRATEKCIKDFASAYGDCCKVVPWYAAKTICWPLKVSFVCNLMRHSGEHEICDSRRQIDPGLGEGLDYLLKVKDVLTKNLSHITLQQKINFVREPSYIQDAKETGERVMHAFEEKDVIMRYVLTVVDVCVALLFLRIFTASCKYHDFYLTSIDYDNFYITGYFKSIDQRRRRRNKYTLLPLKKMERSKYIDVHSLKYVTAERRKLVTHILKVMLEVITATTFVMLDRLFYEALDVVRKHAEVHYGQEATHDLEIEVKGTGIIAGAVNKIISELSTPSRVRRTLSYQRCLPRPSLISSMFYLKIYGGYLWILLLLYINPYTLRLRRLICSYFYPHREKQRVLHLYNDILKKRMKMQKTLRKKAVQAVRAHYLSGENLLSLRMKFPQLLGWLKIFPTARMTCLICGETKPRNVYNKCKTEVWRNCRISKCPFVYCPECWKEVEKKCLACDPSLAEMSDVDSLSEDENLNY